MTDDEEIEGWLKDIYDSLQYETAMQSFMKEAKESKLKGVAKRDALRAIADRKIDVAQSPVIKELLADFNHNINEIVKVGWDDLQQLTRAKCTYIIIGIKMHMWIDKNISCYEDDDTDDYDVLAFKNIFCQEKGGIGERKDLWILLIASEAQGNEFQSLPDFINRVYNTWDNIPFEREKAYKSLQDKMKGQAWSSITNKYKMEKFIADLTQQKAKRATYTNLANRLYMALESSNGLKITF